MISLADLKKGIRLKCLVTNDTVTVVDVQWHGTTAVSVVYKDSKGQVKQEILYRDREPTQHLIRRLKSSGEKGAAELAARLGGGRSEDARSLAYRLYAICERKGWATEALDYNSLVISWPEILQLANEPYPTGQKTLFD